MSQPSPNSDGVDRLLADFFKSQMPHPWPSAPVPEGNLAEPSSLRAAPEPRRSADPGRRPRLTLAVSVALLLGALWFMSAGSTPGSRPLPARPGAGPGDLISGGSAKLPKEFDRKDKKEDPEKTGFMSGPITLP
jgi:hypothetical protein